ncbi:MAG: hypothetical protein ACSHXK_12845 [Oceanococcus sp.]
MKFSMMTPNYKLFGFALLSVLTLGISPAQAQSDQFYFLGSQQALGSLSNDAGTVPAVYLRWDSIEQDLPSDITEVELLRNGIALPVFRGPAQGLMSASEIKDLYNQAGQGRRKAEMLARLSDEAAAQTGGSQINNQNFASVIHNRLQSDPLWNQLASRLDFNIARARYRAYLDRDVAGLSYPIIYELRGLGKDSGGNDVSVRLGRIEIVDASHRPVPPAADFRQVHTARCDAPEYSLDHGSVALTWTHGGLSPIGQNPPQSTALDNFLASLAVSGYDLYRSRDNVDANVAPVALDIASLARSSGHDARGQIHLDGLEKVNDQAVVVSARQTEQDFVQHRQTRIELNAANLQPGDARDYYLVPRDYAGQYGPTVVTRVVVPDLLKPEAPWEISLRQNSEKDELMLRWDAVNVANYLQRHGATRKICNADTARSSQRVAWVDKDEQCGVATPREVNLDVGGYLVYRFERFDQAARFMDSDGDGYSDDAVDGDPNHAERDYSVQCRDVVGLDGACEANANQVKSSGPGTACNATLNRGGPSFRIAPEFPILAREVQATNGQLEVEFKDDQPAFSPGKIFWYRVASFSRLDNNGNPQNISRISPPIRAKYNNYALPARDALAGKIVPAIRNQDCLDYRTRSETQTAGPVVALDETLDADSISLSCAKDGVSSHQQAISSPLLLPIVRKSFAEAFGSDRELKLSQQECNALARQCEDQTAVLDNALAVTYWGDNQSALGRENISGVDWQACSSNQAAVLFQQDNGSCNAPFREQEPGESSGDKQSFYAKPDANSCITVWQNFAGQPRKLETVCHPFEGFFSIFVPSMKLGELPCYSATLHNENNRVSPQLSLGCFPQVADGRPRPAPPQPTKLAFVGEQALVEWRRPRERSSATIIELFAGSDVTSSPVVSTMVSHADGGLGALDVADVNNKRLKVGRRDETANNNNLSAIPQTLALDIGPLSQDVEEYCVRLRTVGVGAWEDSSNAVSISSPLRCAERTPPSQPLPEYMAWPQRAVPSQGAVLPTRYSTNVAAPLIPLTVPQTLPQAVAGCTDAARVEGIGLDGGLAASAPGQDFGSFSNAQEQCSQAGAGECKVTPQRICQAQGPAQDVNNSICGHYRQSLDGQLGFVAYRQSRQGASGEEGDFYQISPLVDRLYCDTDRQDQNGSEAQLSMIRDPYIAVLLDTDARFQPSSQNNDLRYQLAFEDRYPHRADQQYRYELVWFDRNGEITHSRRTNWMVIQ